MCFQKSKMSDVSDDETPRLSTKRALDGNDIDNTPLAKKQQVSTPVDCAPRYLSDSDDEPEFAANNDSAPGEAKLSKGDVRKNDTNITMVELASVDKFVNLLAGVEAFPQLQYVEFTISPVGIQMRAASGIAYLRCFLNKEHFVNYNVTDKSTVYISKSEVGEMKTNLKNNMTMVKLGIDPDARIVIHAKKEYKTGGEADCKLSLVTVEPNQDIDEVDDNYDFHVYICSTQFAENLSYIGNNLDVELNLTNTGMKMIGFMSVQAAKKSIVTKYEEKLPTRVKSTGRFDAVKFKPVTATKTLDSKIRISFNNDDDPKSKISKAMKFAYYFDKFEPRSHFTYFASCQLE